MSQQNQPVKRGFKRWPGRTLQGLRQHDESQRRQHGFHRLRDGRANLYKRRTTMYHTICTPNII